MIQISRRKSSVISLAAANLFTKLVWLTTLATLARTSSKDDVAAYLLGITIYQASLPALRFSLDQVIYFLTPTHKEESRQILITATCIIFANCLLLWAILLLTSAFIPFANISNFPSLQYLTLISLYAAGNAPSTVFESALIASGRPQLAALTSVLRQTLAGAITIATAISTQSAYFTLAASAISGITFFAIFLPFILTTLPGKSRPLSTKKTIPLLRLAAPIAGASIVDQATKYSDRIAVAILLSPAIFAEYSLGAFELPIYGLIGGAVGPILLAEARVLISKGEAIKAIALFRRASAISMEAAIPLMMFCFINATPITNIAFTSDYNTAPSIFAAFTLLAPLRTFTFAPLLVALGKGKALFKRSVLGILISAALMSTTAIFGGPIQVAATTVLIAYFWYAGFSIAEINKGAGTSFSDLVPLNAIARLIAIYSAPTAATLILPHACCGIEQQPLIVIGLSSIAFLATLSLRLFIGSRGINRGRTAHEETTNSATRCRREDPITRPQK